MGLRGDLARGQGCSRHGVPGLTGTLPWSGDSLCRPGGLAGGWARLGSSGHPPGWFTIQVPCTVSFLVTSLLAELAPPGPPLSGKEGPPRKSNRVTGFCSGFLPHLPPSVFSPWLAWPHTSLTPPGIPAWPHTALSPRGQGEAHLLPMRHGKPLPYLKLWALLPKAPPRHTHPAVSPGRLGQGVPVQSRAYEHRACDRSEGLMGCPPGQWILEFLGSLNQECPHKGLVWMWLLAMEFLTPGTRFHHPKYR